MQSANSLRQARAIDVTSQQKTYTDQLSRSNPNDAYSFRVTGRSSSFSAQLSGVSATTRVDLIRDRNNNRRVDRGERLASATASELEAGKLTRKNLSSGNYLLNVSTKGGANTNYQLAVTTKNNSTAWAATKDDTGFLALRPRTQSLISALPSSTSARNSSSTRSISTNRWNASFINRSRSNLTDFRSYDFSRPAANVDLGSSGASGRIAARLKADFGRGRPVSGVQRDNFAAQAWTRVNLKAGQFYRIRSDSNDGTRFFFRDVQSGRVLTELSGDWRNRSASQPEWTQVVKVPQGGQYDFFVQYYERSGASVIDVTLEEYQPTGRVVATSGVNVRSQPTTGSTPIGRGMDGNEQFKILRQVQSSGDAVYPSWYEIQTNSGQRGYVAAADNLVRVTDRNGSVTLGSNTILPPTNPTNPSPIVKPPSNTGSSGVITKRLFDFYNQRSNYNAVYDNVMSWYGSTSNACVAFVSSALRLSGYNVPKTENSKGNVSLWTSAFSKHLEDQGWTRSTNSRNLQPGDVVFTDDGGYGDGIPMHVYMFAGWADEANQVAHVVDNQGFNHKRNINVGGGGFNFTPFAYFLRA